MTKSQKQVPGIQYNILAFLIHFVQLHNKSTMDVSALHCRPETGFHPTCVLVQCTRTCITRQWNRLNMVRLSCGVHATSSVHTCLNLPIPPLVQLRKGCGQIQSFRLHFRVLSTVHKITEKLVLQQLSAKSYIANFHHFN